MTKRMLWSCLVILIGFSVFNFSLQNVQAKTREIHVYFEGERLKFEDTDPIVTNGRTLVPFRKIFETLGFEVEWIGGDVRKAIGEKAGLTIELTINSNKAKVNGKTIELDVPAQIVNGRTLVPLRFVSENSGYHVYFADEAGTFIIGIGSTEESANPGVTKQPPIPVSSSGDVEPYVIKGRVVNSQGQPLPWAEVWADNTFLYDSNILGVSDEQGYYRLELPHVNTSYRLGGKYEIDYQGKSYTIYMKPKPDHPVTASTGAVKDLVLDINFGVIELYNYADFELPDDENATMFEMNQVEVRLTPVGKLIDGSTGSTITGYPTSEVTDNIKGIPIGTYEVTVIWKPEGYKPIPLLVRTRNTGQYKESVTFNFENPFSDFLSAQLEIKFP